SAVFGVGAMGLVLRVAGRRVRGQAVSIYRSGFLIGGIVGPALGGAVLGISLRAPFFLYAGTLALAAVVAAAFLSRRRTAEREPVSSAADDAAATAGEDAASEPTATEPDEGHGADPKVLELLRTPEY